MKKIVIRQSKRQFFFLMVFVLTLLVSMMGCTPQQQSEDVLTVGILATLTGPAAIHGTHVMMGAEQAAQELNAQGAKIKLVVEDNKNDPKEALSAYQKLKLLNPDIIFTTMSGASASIIPLASQEGVPVITSLTYADFREYPNVYQYFQTTEHLSDLAVGFFEQQNITKVALLSQNIEAGHALMNVAREKFKAAGITIVAEEFYGSEPDHRTEVLKVVAKKPEAIYVFDLRPDQIVTQIKNQYKGPIVFTDTPVSTNLYTLPEMTGVYAAAHRYMITGTADNTKFRALFGEKDGNAEAGMGYDVVYLISEKFDHTSESQTWPQSVIGTFTGLNGEIDLSSRKPTIPMQMVLVKEGELVPVGSS